MEKLVANLTGRAKRQTYLGREYLVAPATLIVPGVLNGSQGPLLYPEEELQLNPVAWDDLPIIVYHPANNTSGRKTDVLDRQGIGRIYNARYSGGLKADLWFEEDRVMAVDPRVYDALLNGTSIELSTGLGVDQENAPEGSVHNGVEYTAVARNYRPDHLAILPDQVGACSLKDGCGVYNEQSMDDLRMAIDSAVRERYGNASSTENDVWVVDVYSNYLIYRSGEGLYRIGYSTPDGKITIADADPVEVRRKTEYEPVSNLDGQVGSSDSLLNREPDMANMKPEERKTIIDGLISNSCCWDEKDRPELEAMTDNQLRRTKEAADKAVENEQILTAAEKGFNDGRDEINFNREKREWARTTKETPVGNQAAVLSDEDRATLNAAKVIVENEAKRQAEEKSGIISHILGKYAENDRAKHKAALETMNIDQLRAASGLIQEQPNRYVGQPYDTHNQQKLDQTDMLVEPEPEEYIVNNVIKK
jgi:hypothetical protein